MKFTDKMQLLKQGVSFAEIKELEMEEAAEIEALFRINLHCYVDCINTKSISTSKFDICLQKISM